MTRADLLPALRRLCALLNLGRTCDSEMRTAWQPAHGSLRVEALPEGMAVGLYGGTTIYRWEEIEGPTHLHAVLRAAVVDANVRDHNNYAQRAREAAAWVGKIDSFGAEALDVVAGDLVGGAA